MELRGDINGKVFKGLYSIEYKRTYGDKHTANPTAIYSAYNEAEAIGQFYFNFSEHGKMPEIVSIKTMIETFNFAEIIE